MTRPETAVVAEAIAGGNGAEHDSWVKHQNKFSDLNFQSRDEFKAHIEKTLHSKTTTVLEVRGATI